MKNELKFATKEQLHELFPGGGSSLDKLALIREIVHIEIERCRYEDVELRTLPEFWHQEVKPILVRCEGEDETLAGIGVD